MNELKPEDVMRAVRLCAGSSKDNCADCPYHYTAMGYNDYCKEDLLIGVQQLLAEKDAEIERLKHQISIYRKMIDIIEAKFEMLDFLTKKARAEAIADVVAQLEAEVDSSDKYIAEYDGSKVQVAYNKGLRNALKIVKEMEACENGETDL